MILLLLMSKLGKTILIHALKASRRNSDVQLRSQIFRQMKQKFSGCSGTTDKNLKYGGKDASKCATRTLRGDALNKPDEYQSSSGFHYVHEKTAGFFQSG